MYPEVRKQSYRLNLLIVWAVLISVLPLSRPASTSTYEMPRNTPYIVGPTTQAAIPPLNYMRQWPNDEMFSIPQHTAGKIGETLAISAQQGQVITSTWNFAGGPEGWEPVDFRGDGPSYWEANPSLGGSTGVWQTIASSNVEYRYAYVMSSRPVSLDRVTLDYYIRESGFNVGGATFWIYTSTNRIDWTLAATIPQYEPVGGGHYSRSANVSIDHKYVMVGMRINRAFASLGAPHPYGYLDNVIFRNCSGCGPLSLKVIDSNNSLVSHLSNNNEGWPIPNPLTAIVTFSCPAGGANCTDAFNLTMGSTNNARFFMYAKELGADQDPMIIDCTDVFNGPTPYSHESYVGVCTRAAVPGSTTFTVLAGDTRTLEWQVWIQPSEAADLDFTAIWGTNVVTWTVQIPQAQIRPLVFLPGYLGTYPPEFGPEYGGQGKIDPLNKFYDNLIDALEQTGYEKGLAGSGATLIPFPYDWQLPLGDTGSITLTTHIQFIQNSTNQKTYANYNQVDMIAHSAGGLVARAYLERTGINNDQIVHTLVTLGTPHRGVPGAYVGKYGGDPTPLLPKPVFNNLLSGILYCDGKEVEAINVYRFPPESYYEYFSENAPSIEDFMPRADEVSPSYLIDSSGTPFPYPTPSGSQKPPSLFLDDLNTGGGLYDVTKLGNVTRTISSYASGYTTTFQYQVEPPPSNPPYPDFWKYGTATLPITQFNGDLLVPIYSANLTEIAALAPYTNITSYQEGADYDFNDPSTWPPTHVGFTYVPYMVRRIISYTTGIDISTNEDFWNIEYVEPSVTEKRIIGVSCSPVRILITDPQGRRVGLDLNSGQIINEIPGAFVTEDGIDPQLIMLPDIEGIYQVEGMGVASGDYKIGVIKGITNPVVIGSFEGVTTISQVYNFAVTNPPPTPIFLPIILKNSTGTPTLLAPSIDGTDSIFRSPIAKPKPKTPSMAVPDDN